MYPECHHYFSKDVIIVIHGCRLCLCREPLGLSHGITPHILDIAGCRIVRILVHLYAIQRLLCFVDFHLTINLSIIPLVLLSILHSIRLSIYPASISQSIYLTCFLPLFSGSHQSSLRSNDYFRFECGKNERNHAAKYTTLFTVEMNLFLSSCVRLFMRF